MNTIFKTLVTAAYISFVLVSFMPFFYGYFYDAETINILYWSGYGSDIKFGEFIFFAFFAAYSASFIGLLNYKSWARTLFVFLTFLSIIFSGLSGMLVQTPIESLLSYITNVFDGAAIVIMYFTSTSLKFNESA